jgi:lipoprotein-anchoring transpeptidase ErfK/SrfK
MAQGVRRRRFLAGAGAALAATAGGLRIARAEPQASDDQWAANHEDTRLLGEDGAPTAWLPQYTLLRISQWRPRDMLQVWVPRYGLVGLVRASAVGPIPTPSAQQLADEQAKPAGANVIDKIGLPARIAGSANLRLWPDPTGDTLLRTLGHNAPIRAVAWVEGETDDEWYQVDYLDAKTYEAIGTGYVLGSRVRLPRMPFPATTPDRNEAMGKRLEADLKEPAMITAYEDGAPIWSTLSLKGTAAKPTPPGVHRILWRVANETMTSERVYPPIPRNAPGGYYLTGVLYTQYFTGDGASIHYNYWSSNWGYAGSHGCLGIAYNEAKWAWDWAEVGTPVRVFT